MQRVVLADDEKKIVLLIQKLIDWEKLGYEIAGTANDGLAALEQVEKLQPDLLITDIRMPGIDGLELIRQAKERNPNLHFIIISGYREFEYAQTALKYGVEDYLLKPLKKDELEGILIRIRQKIGEETEIRQQLQMGEEHMQQMLLDALKKDMDRKGCFLSAVQMNQEYGFNFSNGRFMAAIIKPDVSSEMDTDDGYQILMKNALKIVRKEVSEVAIEYAAGIWPEGIGVILNVDRASSIEARQCFTRIRQEIGKYREMFWEMRVSVFIGSSKDYAHELTESMAEAIWLCKDRLCRIQAVRIAENEKVNLSQVYDMDPASQKRLQELAEYMKVTDLQKEMEDSYFQLISAPEINGQLIESWFNQVLHACLAGMKMGRQAENAFLQDMRKEFWRCSNAKSVCSLLEKNILEKIKKIQEEKALQESAPIMEAKGYIRDHYREEIRLEDVSSLIGFNATYFSTMFKKETGENFSDYLTRLRITKAKELLLNDNISVADAAGMVGYKDIKYFSRLFKKVAGINPSDYKKLYK